MMLFGRLADPTKPASKENLPDSFHKYPMRQAIEEGFILDVLEGYIPYKAAFNLGKDMVDTKRGRRQGREARIGEVDDAAPDQRGTKGPVHHGAFRPRTSRICWMARPRPWL